MPLPNAEPIGLPAPAWLLQFLLVLTFVLHVVPMSITLGGSLAGLVMEVRGRLQPDKPFRALAGRIWGALPSVTAFTITLGVAPLLFVQLIYGKFFYPASILTGWSWFAVIPVLIVGYYLLYLQAMGPAGARWRPWAGLGAALCFLAIAGIYVSTISMTTEPESWKALYAASQRGVHFLVNLPRWLHVLFGATAMAGGLMALFGHLSEERPFSLHARTCGTAWVGLSLLAQAPVSLWYLSTFSETARGAVALWIPAAAESLAAVGLLLLWVSRTGAARPVMGWSAMGALVASAALLAVQRHLVRQALLSPHIDVATDWKLQPQWDVFTLFALLLVATIGLLAYLVVRYLRALKAQEPGQMSRTAD
ncbi:MAG: hypothetical protein ACOY93_13355 [Bacillota bacterium]